MQQLFWLNKSTIMIFGKVCFLGLDQGIGQTILTGKNHVMGMVSCPDRAKKKRRRKKGRDRGNLQNIKKIHNGDQGMERKINLLCK